MTRSRTGVFALICIYHQRTHPFSYYHLCLIQSTVAHSLRLTSSPARFHPTQGLVINDPWMDRGAPTSRVAYGVGGRFVLHNSHIIVGYLVSYFRHSGHFVHLQTTIHEMMTIPAAITQIIEWILYKAVPQRRVLGLTQVCRSYPYFKSILRCFSYKSRTLTQASPNLARRLKRWKLSRPH